MIHPSFNIDDYLAGAESKRKRQYVKRRNRQPRECSICGQVLLCVKDPADLPGHAQSVYHNSATRIRALLAQDCLTFMEIGRRVGVSRERVRQIAGLLALADTGHTRTRACTLLRREVKRGGTLPSTHPKLKERLAALQGQGFTVDVPVNHRGRNYARYFTANGYDCHICLTHCSTRKTNPRAKGAYYRLQDPRGDCDFLILYVSQEDAAYVVPREWCPKTLYIPRGRTEGYHGQHQRDWEQWLEAWHLLAQPEAPC
jgi:hypothetical protein